MLMMHSPLSSQINQTSLSRRPYRVTRRLHFDGAAGHSLNKVLHQKDEQNRQWNGSQ